MNMKGIELRQINEAAVRADLEKMGVTARQVSLSMGANRNFIATVFNRGVVGVDIIRKIERAMFKEDGAYTLPVEPQAMPQAKPETTDRVLKHLDTHLFEIGKQIAAVGDSKELLQKLADIETAIKANSTWLARIYAVWTNEKGDQKDGK